MAAVSIAGTVLNVVLHEVPLALWYSALPGVTIAGLFRATYLAVKLGAKNVLLLFTACLSADFFISFWTQETIPLSYTIKVLATYILLTYLVVLHVKIFKKSYSELDACAVSFQEHKDK